MTENSLTRLVYSQPEGIDEVSDTIAPTSAGQACEGMNRDNDLDMYEGGSTLKERAFGRNLGGSV